MMSLDRVRYIFPKIVIGLITSLFLLSGNAFAETYVAGPSDGSCGSCRHHYYHRVVHHSCYKKKIRRYHPCYHRCRSSYSIRVYYPQYVTACCQPINYGCSTCSARVMYRPCYRHATTCYRNRSYCNSCGGRWYQDTTDDFDYDRRTADDVYSDF